MMRRVPLAACQPVCLRLGNELCQPKLDIASWYGTMTIPGSAMN